MYGYVVVNKPELKIKEYDMYRSYYCGLCEELLSDYGINGQISISYDMTFLLVLLTGLYEPDTTYKEARCIAHPVHKHPVRRNKISAYVADMNVLMTYYKCVDDWQDDRKLMKKLLASSLTNKVKRIEKAYSQKARIIKAALDRMSELENNNESNIDLLAEQFGIIMAQRKYARIPAPQKQLKITHIIRISVGSILKYSAIPPHTPQIIQFTSDLYKRLFSIIIPPRNQC